MAVRLWGRCKNGKSLAHLLSAPLQRENKLNENDELNDAISHSQEVAQLLEDLRLARASDSVISVDLARAEAVVADLNAQRGRLAAQLRDCEEALAASGDLPSGAFPQEASIADVDRRIRVARSRVELIGGRVADSRANIDSLKKALGGALGQFVRRRLSEVRARYRATALALRDIYAEQLAWCEVAARAGVKVPAPAMALVADAEPIDNKRELLDGRDMVRSDAEWQKFSGPLYARLSALRTEVSAAIGETKPPQSKPTPAAVEPAPVHRLGDPETRAMVFSQQASHGAASPAPAGADLEEHGL